jgi:hypothetical protein
LKKVLGTLISLLCISAYADTTTVQADDSGITAGVINVSSQENHLMSIPYGINPTNLLTIKAKSRSKKENANHQLYCSTLGGVDVTDDNDVQISKDTVDAIFCKVVDDTKFNKYAIDMKMERDEIVSGKLARASILDPIPNGSWQAFAPSGTISGNYYATSAGVFNDLNGKIYVDVSVPSDRCAGSNEGYVNGYTRMTATTICTSWSGGQQPSYGRACFNGSCVQDRGWITHK